MGRKSLKANPANSSPGISGCKPKTSPWSSGTSASAKNDPEANAYLKSGPRNSNLIESLFMPATMILFAQDGGDSGILLFILFFFFFGLIPVICLWILFEKAGQPGWAAIIPFYSTLIMLRIAGRPEWWLLGMFIPFV